MKLKYLPAYIILVPCLLGCNNNGASETVMKLLEERDSLKEMNVSQGKRLDAIGRLMTTINQAVDSIAESEGVLFLNVDGEGLTSKQDVLHNLENFEMLLKRQQTQIHEMQLRLGEDSNEVDGIISVMRQQLEAKDRMIVQLKAELAKKDVDIVQLRRTVNAQKTKLTEQDEALKLLNKTNTAQAKALQTQDAVINECYVIIKSKKELQQLGIIKKGKIVADAALHSSAFMKIDIRKAKEFAFQAKKPKILSNMPQSSYILTTNGYHYFTLRISNATAFWSLSNYLIIQTD